MKSVDTERCKNTALLAGGWGGWRGRALRPPAIHLGRYCFQPAWVMTLLTLVLVSLLAGLGFWQLARADAKAQLIERFDHNSALPALDLNRLKASGQQLEYRHATANGEYQDTPVILLNNQINQGRIGFHLLGLFRLMESDKYLLINQGWIPATIEGKPTITASRIRLYNSQTVQGLLVPAPRVGLRLGELRYRPDAPVMELPYLDPLWLGRALNVDLQPFVLLQNTQIIDQYKQQRKTIWLNPERHRGYALQWFSLALALVMIYLLTNLKRKGRDS